MWRARITPRTYWGEAPGLVGQVELAQKARLDGLTISVRCAPRRLRREP
jgi:hypothetical protein